MEEKNKILFLEVNNKKSVQLKFIKGYLDEIIISVKKYKELVGNGVIDKESILDIEKVTIIMPSSKQNEILVENGRKYLSEDPKENDVNQTGKFSFRIKDPEREPFHFYVKNGVKYTERSLQIQSKKGR